MIGPLVLCAASGVDAPTELVESRFEVPASGQLVALRDVDGDGDRDLLRIDGEGVHVHRLGPEARFGRTAEASLPWPGDHLAWDLADLSGEGRVELIVFRDGRRVEAFDLGAIEAGSGAAEGRLLVESRGYLPRGIGRMALVHDVDGDGRGDLVLPGSGRYAIHRQLDGAGFSPALHVSYQADVGHRVGRPTSLSSSFEQRVEVPIFTMDDIDGDGRLDLVSETDDRVYFHLASPELSDEPTWELDLAALNAQLPVEDGIDFDDLLSHVGRRVDWRVLDLDREGAHELLVQVGSTVKVYAGGSRTGPTSSPDQLLRSSGNVLYFFLRDVQGDAMPDLQLVRGEGLSLGRILRWLILPGSLDFDLYTYRNDGGEFATRPTRRNRISLKIPRLLSFIDEVEAAGEEFEAQMAIPARLASLDGDGAEDDVVDLIDGELVVHLGAAPEGASADEDVTSVGDLDGLLELFLLRDLDELGDGGTKTLDLGDIEEWSFSSASELRDACADRRPELRAVLALPTEDTHLRVKDLDGDGRSDLIAYGQRGEDEGRGWVVQFFVAR